MNSKKYSSYFTTDVVSLIAAIVILLDLIIPGNVLTEPIKELKSKRQQYYNAAKNSHYSYKVITSNHEFAITEDDVQLFSESKPIEFSVSQFFKEINWYRTPNSNNKSRHSLRLYSALILPILILIIIGSALIRKKRANQLIFILQVLLIGNLVFLLS